MFNGIVETIGTIKEIKIDNHLKHFEVIPTQVFSDLVIGESIAINGVCLTVTAFTPLSFYVTVVPETLRVTNLDLLQVGSQVNLERSMTANGRFSGHYVQGHVDGVGQILSLEKDGSDALLVKISIPTRLSRYVVRKGYITLDGMSITVIDVDADSFTVTFIPHTQAVTIIKSHYQIGAHINLEVDVMSKYIERLLEVHINENTYRTS